MSFYRKIKYFLVHTLNLTNKEASQAIENGWVKINNETITQNVIIDELSEIKFNGRTCLCDLIPGTRLFIAYTISNQYILLEGIGLRSSFGLPD